MKKLIYLLCISLIIMTILTSCGYVAGNSGNAAGSAGEQDITGSDNVSESENFNSRYIILSYDEVRSELAKNEELLNKKKEAEEAQKAFKEFAKTAGSADAVEFEVLGEKYMLMPYGATSSTDLEYNTELEYIYENETVRCSSDSISGWGRQGFWEWKDTEIKRRDDLSTSTVNNLESAKDIAEKFLTETAFPGLDLAEYDMWKTDYVGGNSESWEEIMLHYVRTAEYAVCGEQVLSICVDKYGIVTLCAWRVFGKNDLAEAEKKINSIVKLFPEQKSAEEEIIKRYRNDYNIPESVECQVFGYNLKEIYGGKYGLSVSAQAEAHGSEYKVGSYYIILPSNQK